MESIAILMPVYNDWASLEQVIRRVDACLAEARQPASIVVVDDGSTIDPPAYSFSDLQTVRSVRCLHLAANQGHQRAIAIGLVALAADPYDVVIVMDADGEDRPEDVVMLLERRRARPDHVIVARRARRSEGIIFAIFYGLYKVIFWLLTGSEIRFGNFCLIPRRRLLSLIYQPDLWNHLAATIRRSRLPLLEAPAPRGKRLAGRSSMNFTSLVLHGLSAISVYLDLVAVRILLFSLVVAALAALGIITAVLVRYLTPLAIPGWETTVVGLLTIIIMQAILFSASVLFGVLSARSRRQVIPAVDAPTFIRAQEDWLTSPTRIG